MILALVIITLVALGLAAVAVWREPRRATNAVLCGGAAMLLLMTATVLPVGAGSMALAVLFVALVSPLLAVGLVVVLIGNGVQMLRREGRSLGNLLSGLAGVGLVAAMVLSLGLVTSDSSVAAAGGIWIMLAVAWFGFLFTCMVVYQAAYSRITSGLGRPDFLMVLGAGLVRGKVGRLLGSRVDTAVALAGRYQRAGKRPVLVMSGGQGWDEPRSEAAAMSEYASTELAVPSAGILTEDASTTTEENMVFTHALVEQHPQLGPDAKGLAVTSNFHVLRAAELARREGLALHVTGAPVAWYYWPSAILREFVAQLTYHRWILVVGTALVTLPLPLVVALG